MSVATSISSPMGFGAQFCKVNIDLFLPRVRVTQEKLI
jgi:hypothetical protein